MKCRMGHDKVVKLLMEKNQWMASKLNCENQSTLFMACSYGHLSVVGLLLNHTSGLLDIVDEAACLRVAAVKGRTDIAKKVARKVSRSCPKERHPWILGITLCSEGGNWRFRKYYWAGILTRIFTNPNMVSSMSPNLGNPTGLL